MANASLENISRKSCDHRNLTRNAELSSPLRNPYVHPNGTFVEVVFRTVRIHVCPQHRWFRPNVYRIRSASKFTNLCMVWIWMLLFMSGLMAYYILQPFCEYGMRDYMHIYTLDSMAEIAVKLANLLWSTHTTPLKTANVATGVRTQTLSCAHTNTHKHTYIYYIFAGGFC